MKHIKLFESFTNESNNDDSITAYNWWRETLSSNEQKALLSKYDPYYGKISTHNHPKKELMIDMWKKEGAPTTSDFLIKHYGYGDLTDKDLLSKLLKKSTSKETAFTFFDVQFGLNHALKKGKITEKELDQVLDSINSNRISMDDLKKIMMDHKISSSEEIISDIQEYIK